MKFSTKPEDIVQETAERLIVEFKHYVKAVLLVGSSNIVKMDALVTLSAALDGLDEALAVAMSIAEEGEKQGFIKWSHNNYGIVVTTVKTKEILDKAFAIEDKLNVGRDIPFL